VHRVLAANKMTFGACLLDARIDLALQTLMSPASVRWTTGEVARQCGFMSTAYFSRVFRKHTGHPPQSLRRMRH
jgi:AraC-like DNA-binding protein